MPNKWEEYVNKMDSLVFCVLLQLTWTSIKLKQNPDFQDFLFSFTTWRFFSNSDHVDIT